MDRFLVQVSKDAGYANIVNRRRYENGQWAQKLRDRDHGKVQAGDELLVYCTSNVPNHCKTLAFSVKVQNVSSGNEAFELGEPQLLKSPIPLEQVIALVENRELPEVFLQCGQQGFNIAKVDSSDVQHTKAIDRLIRGEDDNRYTWDKLVAQAKAFMDTGQLESVEINYKVEIGHKLAEARQAVLSGDQDWGTLVKRGFVGNLIHNVPMAKFRDWIDKSPGDALVALKTVWAENDIADSDRIREFAQRFPATVTGTKGAGTRMNTISVLLMGIDVEKFPPFRITFFDDLYKRVGYDLPSKDADEATLYEHALGFLDRFIEEADNRGLKLRHRLDAQSVLWMLPPNINGGNRTDKEKVGEPDLADLARRTYLTEEFLQEIADLLEDKKQVIFQGPPGTGKTYVAQELAECLAGSKGRVTLVQFHPSYAYEDFVQGFRPRVLNNGQPGFVLQDGPLLRAADRALADAEEDNDAKHFLVIDEINRGNLAKVFGELYFLLEYRDKPMDLQYSNTPFSLPENLYIIGTMNTADRSIALVDLALRRRFHFVEFHPDDEPVRGVLGRFLKEKSPDMAWVADIVEQANRQLEKDRDAAIGPSYFMKESLNEEQAKRIWKHNVLPYVAELLHGQPERLKAFEELDALRRPSASDSAPSDNAEGGDPDSDPEGQGN